MALNGDVKLDDIASKPRMRSREMLGRERRQLLVEWNQTEMEFPLNLCVHELFEAQARRTPEALAMRAKEGVWSYAQLDASSNRVAHWLRARGVRPDDRVAICAERGLALVAGLLGILKSGACYVPLDPSYPQERLEYMLEDSAPRVVLVGEGLEGRMSAGGASVVLDARLLDTGPSMPLARAPGQGMHSLAYVIYTSGSTGRPKGVMVEHGNLANFLSSMSVQFGLGTHDTLLAVTTVSFDIAGLELYLPLVQGACLCVASSSQAVDAEWLCSTLSEQHVTMMQATPVTWRMLLDHGWVGHAELTALCGGEALSSSLSGQLIPRCKQLWNLYGPTETTIWSSSSHIKVAAKCSIEHIGRPIANTRFYVLDESGMVVPVGGAGELYIGGAGVARGYLNRPDLTAERFIENPFVAGERLYRTGDLARYLPDGNVEYLGRLDLQVKIRGVRIEPGEIEAVLTSYPDVTQAVVVTQSDRSGNEHLIAYVVPRSGACVESMVLRRYAARFLPQHMVPLAVTSLNKLPVTPNGKLDRAALPAATISPTSNRLPVTQGESVLASLFAKLLGFDAVGVEDNFFDLGGHSILAARLLNNIASQTGVTIPLRVFFETPTVLGLANFVSEEKKSTGCQGYFSVDAPNAVLIQRGDHRTIIFFIHALDGDVSQYHKLAAEFGSDVTVYGFAANNLSTKEYMPDSVEKIAENYIGQIRSIQGNGPYHLAGWSSGGVIAFQMAVALTARGEEIGSISILDTKYDFSSPIVSLPRAALREGLSNAQNQRNAEWCTFLGIFLAPWESNDISDNNHSFWRSFWKMSDRAKVGHVISYAKDKKKISDTLSSRDLIYLFLNMRRQMKALSLYVPPVYAGSMNLFLTSDSLDGKDAQECWKCRSTGQLNIVPIIGNHLAVVEHPGTTIVAETIKACLRRPPP